MDATSLADSVLRSVPANETLGIRVDRAVDGDAEVSLDVPTHLTNIVGALHASGLAGLVDACGLAAVISVMPDADSVRDLLPLGRTAQLQFLAPARDRLVARCALSDDARAQLSALARDGAEKARPDTDVEIVDAEGVTVCRGRFEWTVRRSR